MVLSHNYATRFAKRDHILHFEIAYLCITMHNQNQTWVFYGAHVSAAIAWKWSIGTATTVSYKVEFLAFAILVNFLKNGQYEGMYLGSSRLLVLVEHLYCNKNCFTVINGCRNMTISRKCWILSLFANPVAYVPLYPWWLKAVNIQEDRDYSLGNRICNVVVCLKVSLSLTEQYLLARSSEI